MSERWRGVVIGVLSYGLLLGLVLAALYTTWHS